MEKIIEKEVKVSERQKTREGLKKQFKTIDLSEIKNCTLLANGKVEYTLINPLHELGISKLTFREPLAGDLWDKKLSDSMNYGEVMEIGERITDSPDQSFKLLRLRDSDAVEEITWYFLFQAKL